ncbi:hypothetical protein DV515_00012523 [Chloebia gouldiae]|uniref:Uncharacterized protein n=1 Tax=Chloebia gouldiae TaxID=44316 RepID=A0A3L8S3A2_CHLGU|nr:hypothetical protein DV515_00012523 [Chloebia gouldiae]
MDRRGAGMTPGGSSGFGTSRAGRAVGWGGGAELAPGARALRASRCSAASGSGDNGTRCPLGEDDEVRPRWVRLRWGYGRQSCERDLQKDSSSWPMLSPVPRRDFAVSWF